MPHLSFIIPAYNEASRIVPSLAKAQAYFAAQAYTTEILVVNDGSTDDTTSVAKSVGGVRVLEQPRNMGKGAAVRRGMMEAKGEFRIFSDADFSTPIYETARVLERLQDRADICIGSRGVDTTLVKKHQPWYRETLGKMVNIVVQAAFIPGISDTQCGFKGFRAAAAEAVFSRAQLNGWMFDLEALYIASKLHLRIDEIPVEWYNDERSTVSFRHSWQIIREILSIKRLHRRL